MTNLKCLSRSFIQIPFAICTLLHGVRCYNMANR